MEDELLSTIMERSKVIAQDMQEELEPVLFLCDGELPMKGLRMNMFPKPMWVKVATKLARILSAERMILVVESWSTNVGKDSPLAPKLESGTIKLSDLPLEDRTEMVIIQSKERHQPTKHYMAEIKRFGGKRIMGEYILQDGSIEGRCVLEDW